MTERTCAECGAPMLLNGHGSHRRYCLDCRPRRKQQRPSVPCSVCGLPMAVGEKSLPAGQATCQKCRRERNPARTCERCGKPCTGPRFCSRSCANQRPISSRARTCELCGDPYRASYLEQRTCGRKCGMVLQARNRPPVEPKPPSCAVHYLQCAECERWFVSSRANVKFCSPECGKKANARTAAQRYRESAGLIGECKCIECGAPMQGFWSKYCETCRPNLNGHVSRAKHYGVPWERVASRKVFERDEWTCGICGEDIDRNAKHPDPWSASLDHVIPMSKGGPHTYDNVQAAHLWCNMVKHNDETFTLRAA